MFQPNNNLPLHYNPGLRNHESFSYGNQGNFQHALQNSSSQYTPPEFHGHGAPSTNFQGHKRSTSFEDTVISLLIDSKKRSDTQDCMLSKVESHVTNPTTSIKNMETQLGQLTSALKEQSPKSFPNVIKKIPRSTRSLS